MRVQYLVDTSVIKKGQKWSAVAAGAAFIIDHSHVNAFGVSANAQTHQTDLNYRQQELKTQWPENKPGINMFVLDKYKKLGDGDWPAGSTII